MTIVAVILDIVAILLSYGIGDILINIFGGVKKRYGILLSISLINVRSFLQILVFIEFSPSDVEQIFWNTPNPNIV